MMLVLVWMHLLAAVVWVGGMIFLSLVLVPILKRDSFAAQRGTLIRAVALRFRALGWGAVAVLLTTGPLLMAARGWPLTDPRRWPAVLVGKLLLVTGVLVLAALHDFLIGPRVSRLMANADPTRHGQYRLWLTWSPWLPRLALLLALGVLAVAVVLARS
jgi:uncharacterized membrane protein